MFKELYRENKAIAMLSFGEHRPIQIFPVSIDF